MHCRSRKYITLESLTILDGLDKMIFIRKKHTSRLDPRYETYNPCHNQFSCFPFSISKIHADGDHGSSWLCCINRR